MLLENKDKIYLVLQTPELPNDIKRLIFNKGFDEQSNIVGATRKFVDKRSSFVNSRLNDLPNEVSVIDMTDYFCNDEVCFASKNKQALYFDQSHPSLFSAEKISSVIIDRHYQTLE